MIRNLSVWQIERIGLTVRRPIQYISIGPIVIAWFKPGSKIEMPKQKLRSATWPYYG